MAKKEVTTNKKEVSIPVGQAKYTLIEDYRSGKKLLKKGSTIVCKPIVADYLRTLKKI